MFVIIGLNKLELGQDIYRSLNIKNGRLKATLPIKELDRQLFSKSRVQSFNKIYHGHTLTNNPSFAIPE